MSTKAESARVPGPVEITHLLEEMCEGGPEPAENCCPTFTAKSPDLDFPGIGEGNWREIAQGWLGDDSGSSARGRSNGVQLIERCRVKQNEAKRINL